MLTFRTESFDAGAGSVLHSGIYNREFSSMLASVGAAFAGFLLMKLSGLKGLLAIGGAVFMALASFPLFRTFVFRETFLKTTIDKKKGTAGISLEGFFGRRVAEFAISEIKSLLIERKKNEIENKDGVEFVKLISLQHNTAIPGFGEETETYALTLKLNSGTDYVIFADTQMEQAIAAHDSIKGFLYTS